MVQSGRLKTKQNKTLANAHDIATKYLSTLLGKLFPEG